MALVLPIWACASKDGRIAGTSEDGIRPNVILIVTDDQTVPSLADMSSVRRRLVESGITFDRAYSTTPICCPQRTSILRGQYSHNHGVTAVSPTSGGFGRFVATGGEASTIATWLSHAGYRTFLAGKYLNGYSGSAPGLPQTYVPPGWDRWFGDLAPQDYFDYRVNDNGVLVDYGTDPGDYLTDVLAGKAIEFIRSMAEQDAPFFMYVAPFAPHDSPPIRSPIPAPRHAHAFADRKAPRGPSFNEADVEDKPNPLVRNRPLLTAEDVAAIDELHRSRLQSLLAVDEMVEAIFSTLVATGELEHTFLFYTSDNGFHLGQHRLPKGKGFPYEEDILVPLVVRGPGVSRGSREHLVLLSDLAPTIAEIARAELPEFVDGRSLIPLLTEPGLPAEEWRKAFLIEYWIATKNGPDRLVWKGLRTHDFKYIEWGPDRSHLELYDLVRDPFELESMHDGADPELASEMATWLEALFECAGKTCRTLEDAPPTAPAM